MSFKWSRDWSESILHPSRNLLRLVSSKIDETRLRISAYGIRNCVVPKMMKLFRKKNCKHCDCYLYWYCGGLCTWGYCVRIFFKAFTLKNVEQLNRCHHIYCHDILSLWKVAPRVTPAVTRLTVYRGLWISISITIFIVWGHSPISFGYCCNYIHICCILKDLFIWGSAGRACQVPHLRKALREALRKPLFSKGFTGCLAKACENVSEGFPPMPKHLFNK